LKNFFRSIRTLGLAFGLIALFHSVGYAGGIGDGGGQGVVCRNDDGSVASAKLLDLVEAQKYFLLKLKDESSSRPYLEIADEYAAILDGANFTSFPTSQWSSHPSSATSWEWEYEINPPFLHTKFIRSAVDGIDAGKMLIPGDDFKIPAVGDSHPLIVPTAKGCGIEQIAIYKDGINQVHFVGAIWEKLSNIDKAGLLIHEALYRSFREMGETTSDRARKTIGYLFSGLKFERVLDGLPKKYLFCWTRDPEVSFRFAVYPNRNGLAVAQFLVYDGQIMVRKTLGLLDFRPFAKKFGLPMSPVGNYGILRSMDNPLLDRPRYDFEMKTDSKGGPVTMTIEASTLMNGKDPKQISCRSQLSSVFYGADGSVGAGPADSPGIPKGI
jgi:hypothetical protein